MTAKEFLENEVGEVHDNPNIDNEIIAGVMDKYAEQRAGTASAVDTIVSVLDDCIEDINVELQKSGISDERVVMLEEERMYGRIFRKRVKRKIEMKINKRFNTIRSWNKANEYSDDGYLKNMEVGDWIVTHNGNVRQIIHDDMNDLKAEEILRFATRKEVKNAEAH